MQYLDTMSDSLGNVDISLRKDVGDALILEIMAECCEGLPITAIWDPILTNKNLI